MLNLFSSLFKSFEEAGEELFFVGGFCRDYLDAYHGDNMSKLPGEDLGSTHRENFWIQVYQGVIDVDFATSALPEKTIEILKKRGFRTIPIGIEFGTIQTIIPTWAAKDIKIEITTYRCDESYKKGSRKPNVKFGKSLKEDLARRDFTINAIAMDEEMNVIDPFGGEGDLIQGLLFTPLDPETSFRDDPLRMLRACRFHSRHIASISHDVGMGMEKMSHKIKEVSSERIFDEVSKILMTNEPSRGLTAMVSTGLMKEIFPEVQTMVEFKQNQGKWHSKLVWPHTLQVVDNTPPILEVRWAALFHDVAKPQTYSVTDTGVHFYQHDWKGELVWDRVARRLKVSNEFRSHVGQLIYEHLQPSQLSADGPDKVSDKALRRLARRLGDRLENLFHLSMADITSHRPDIVEEKRNNCMALKDRVYEALEKEDVVKIKLPKGTGLVVSEALGMKPGPELGKIMKKLEEALVDGEITLESDFALEASKLAGKEEIE